MIDFMPPVHLFRSSTVLLAASKPSSSKRELLVMSGEQVKPLIENAFMGGTHRKGPHGLLAVQVQTLAHVQLTQGFNRELIPGA